MSGSTDIHINLRGQFGYQNLHVHISNVLGTGSYGSVVKATLDHLPCAAKILHTIFFRSDDPGAVDFAARFDQECAILRDLKHPCIVQFLGVVQDPTNRRPILLMELMKESLTEFLERSATSLSYHIQVNITHDIALALVYLHGNNIIHRDLSSNNVLLNAGRQAKVTDFGMSKVVEANPRMTRSKITQCPGTPVFMPPEALRAKPRYSDKLDTFSLGVLMVQIITRMFPAPTDAERVREDPSSPTGEIIIPVPELERRKKDLDKVPSPHTLLPIALHCLKDRDTVRPTAAQLCQKLKQMKTAQAYTASEAESEKTSLDQQLRLMEEERATEIACLKEQVRRLSIKKELQEQIKTAQVYTASEAENERPSLDQQLKLMEEEKAAEIACLKEQVRRLSIKKELQQQEQQQQMKEEEGAESSNQLQTVQRAAVQENDSPSVEEKAIYDAANRGDVCAMKKLLAAHVNVDCTPYQVGWSPLMIASFKGHVDIVRLLVEAKAQLNTQIEDGTSPLFCVSHTGCSDIVNILIRNGADVNLAHNTGATPLFIASQNGHSDVVNILIRNGADINLAYKGQKPMDIAMSEGHCNIVRLLERKGH